MINKFNVIWWVAVRGNCSLGSCCSWLSSEWVMRLLLVVVAVNRWTWVVQTKLWHRIVNGRTNYPKNNNNNNSPAVYLDQTKASRIHPLNVIIVLFADCVRKLPTSQFTIQLLLYHGSPTTTSVLGAHKDLCVCVFVFVKGMPPHEEEARNVSYIIQEVSCPSASQLVLSGVLK